MNVSFPVMTAGLFSSDTDGTEIYFFEQKTVWYPNIIPMTSGSPMMWLCGLHFSVICCIVVLLNLDQ
jgi:hypothetical protein